MRALLLFSTLPIMCASLGRAQSSASSGPAPAAESLPPIFAPKSAAPKSPPPRRATPAPRGGGATPRAISSEMAQKISGVATRAAPAATESLAESPKPSNADPSGTVAAVRLEPYVVNEKKLPNLREREVLTPKGKLDLAHKRNPGLKAGAMPLGNNGVAKDIIEDELAKERRTELSELDSLFDVGTKAAPEVKRKIDEAKLRRNTWIDEIGTPFRPPR